jgi:HEPN domain-containing protein
MTDKDILGQWQDLIERDLRGAELFIGDGDLLLAAFHLQQALEKILKKNILKVQKIQPPYLHNLVQLAEHAQIKSELSEDQQSFLDELNPYYIKARYPTYKKSVADALSDQQLTHWIQTTREFMAWLEQKNQ